MEGWVRIFEPLLGINWKFQPIFWAFPIHKIWPTLSLRSKVPLPNRGTATDPAKVHWLLGSCPTMSPCTQVDQWLPRALGGGVVGEMDQMLLEASADPLRQQGPVWVEQWEQKVENRLGRCRRNAEPLGVVRQPRRKEQDDVSPRPRLRKGVLSRLEF